MTRPAVTKVTDGPVTTYHFGPVPDPNVEDCGCDQCSGPAPSWLGNMTITEAKR
jgi:hypothetical protein